MKKQLILAIWNTTFFGSFIIAFLYESTIPLYELQYSTVAFIFLPATLLYIISYGCLSYVFTKNVILSNVQLLIFVTLYFFCGVLVPFHWLENANFFGGILLSIIVACVSITSSLFTKLIYYIKNKVVGGQSKNLFH